MDETLNSTPKLESENNRARHLVSLLQNGNASSEQEWMDNLSEAALRLIRGGSDKFVETVFWFNLHGLFTEILDSYKKRSQSPLQRVIPEIGESASEIATLIQSTKDCLSREELVYIQKARDICAHVYCESYQLSYLKSKDRESYKLKESRKYKTIDESISHEKSKEIIQTVIERYGSKQRVAVAMAEKVHANICSIASLLAKTE